MNHDRRRNRRDSAREFLVTEYAKRCLEEQDFLSLLATYDALLEERQRQDLAWRITALLDDAQEED